MLLELFAAFLGVTEKGYSFRFNKVWHLGLGVLQEVFARHAPAGVIHVRMEGSLWGCGNALQSAYIY